MVYREPKRGILGLMDASANGWRSSNWRSRCSGLLVCASILLSTVAHGQGTQNLDVVVLLDESGSMYGNARKGEVARDPRFLRYAALQCLLRKLRPGDRFAAIPFGTQALRKATIGPLDPFAQAPDWSALTSVAREGALAQRATNYVDALRAARELLGPPSPGRFRFAVLCTDGEANAQGNSPGEVVAACDWFVQETGARVYPLALGDFGNELLDHMALATGGRRFRANDAADLPFQFANIFRDATEREVKASRDRQTFYIGRSARELRAVAVSSSSSSAFALVAPDGTRIPADIEEPVYAEGQHDRVHWLRVPSPSPGRWRIEGDPASVDLAYESSFRIVAITPTEGDAVRSNGELTVEGAVQGADRTDRLQGTATLTHGSGFVSAPLLLSGEQASAVLDLTGVPPGSATLRLSVRRSADGATEEGIPASVGLVVVEAPPGVPLVQVGWPKVREHRIWSSESITLPLRLVATREARGRSVKFEVSEGWSVLPNRALTLDKGENSVVLTVRGPYGGKRGDFAGHVKVQPTDGVLEVRDGTSAIRVRSLNWVDIVLTALSWGGGLLFLVALFGVLVLMSWYEWKVKTWARANALNCVNVKLGQQVVSATSAGRSSRVRTFGDRQCDSVLSLTPAVEGQLLSVSPGKTFDHVVLRGNRLHEGSSAPVSTIQLRSARPSQVLVYDDQGYGHTLTVVYDRDLGTERRVKTSIALRWATIVALLVAASFAYIRARDGLHLRTYVKEPSPVTANSPE